ncbi:prolyl 4-hydroxylase alpha-subunit [Aureococcus anophagefferens]|nr:prolyl 4-hydroxylase alpha-subunit [Aureococcus anophagefferens]
MGAAGSSARYRSRYSEADAIAACDGQPYDFDEAKWSRVPKGSDGRADLVDILSSLCEGRSAEKVRSEAARERSGAHAPPLGALGWWAPRRAVVPKALRLPGGAAVAAADCRRGSVAGAVDGVLTLAECGAFVEAARRRGFLRARYEAKQRMSKVIVEDGRCAASLWERCRRHLPRFWEANDGSTWRAVGINSHMRVLRSVDSNHWCSATSPAAFGAHRDAFSRRGLTSFVTVQIYLNDGGRDFDGGETRFVGKDRRGAPEDYEDVVPRVGRLLYFDHDLLHEGRLVTRGVKYAIRTELMFEPDA